MLTVPTVGRRLLQRCGLGLGVEDEDPPALPTPNLSTNVLTFRPLPPSHQLSPPSDQMGAVRLTFPFARPHLPYPEPTPKELSSFDSTKKPPGMVVLYPFNRRVVPSPSSPLMITLWGEVGMDCTFFNYFGMLHPGLRRCGPVSTPGDGV